MKIWVDADACPVVIKEILFKAAQRTGVQLTLVANHSIRIPPAKNIKFLQVTQGFDVADDAIVSRVNENDLSSQEISLWPQKSLKKALMPLTLVANCILKIISKLF
jgi:uncharacterized protein YaiI (UPF0178 family)